MLERVQDPKAVGAGILLQPNGLAVLYGLGLQAALREHGFTDRVGVVRNQAGRALVSNELPDFGAGLDHFLAVSRSHLFTVLVDALTSTPGHRGALRSRARWPLIRMRPRASRPGSR